MKVEVHTIRYGEPDWLLECAPTLDAWADRNGYPVHIWTTEHHKPIYPCLKFCVTDMWRKFLQGDSDWCMYIDGDIYIRHDAPAVDFIKSGLYIQRAQRRMNARFPWWCRKFRIPSERIKLLREKWWIRNMGWWIMDHEAADKLLRVVSPPYIEATMEECQANFWMVRAVEEHGLRITSPPMGWINYHWLKNPSWMWHLARPHNKMEALKRIKQEGLA